MGGRHATEIGREVRMGDGGIAPGGFLVFTSLFLSIRFPSLFVLGKGVVFCHSFFFPDRVW